MAKVIDAFRDHVNAPTHETYEYRLLFYVWSISLTRHKIKYTSIILIYRENVVIVCLQFVTTVSCIYTSRVTYRGLEGTLPIY
jgi:hypothetical protein